MEERYEIRGKLGQGGAGAVFRAWDRSLSREVALKRIVTDEGREEEATEQLTKESETLAAMQHPNIVTVYDVDSDEDGPFVVMELITGRTLDEIVEDAPLTWTDFRELCMQVQEGMIAAQDLGLIHQDLKTSNVMLNWLPSGRFQAKIVDFGLARFSPRPSLQETDENDAVMGSIFFMAPEQFERKPVDARTDMYAIGCVYYTALAGEMPFQGETGPQVMAAHLEHRVTPLCELRKDIPKWIDEWIMWHLNRDPGDRPANAREALESFINLDQPNTQTIAQEEASKPRRARLVIPGSEPEPEEDPGPVLKKQPKSLEPPSGAPPSLHTTSVHLPQDPEAAPGAPDPAATAPIPVAVPEAAGATAIPTTPLATAAPTHAGPGQPVSAAATLPTMRSKGGLSQGAKMAIGGIAGVLLIVFAVMLLNKTGTNEENETYNQLVRKAADPAVTEVPVTKAELEVLLSSVKLGSNKDRPAIYKALALARATDGTRVDQRIVEFATGEPIPTEVRKDLIGRVMLMRANPLVIDELLDFAKASDDPALAALAVKAAGAGASDEHLEAFLSMIQLAADEGVRRAAEEAAAGILEESPNPERYGGKITAAYRGSTTREVRQAMLRLAGRTASPGARKIVRTALDSEDQLEQIAALEAARNWPDETMFETLLGFLGPLPAGSLRDRAFDAAYQFLAKPAREMKPADKIRLWGLLVAEAGSDAEKLKIINGLAGRESADWAIELITPFTGDEHGDVVIDRAGKAVDHMKRQQGGD